MGFPETLGDIWTALSPWMGSTAVAIVTVLVVLATRAILSRAANDRRGVPYKRQIATSLIVLAGLFAFIVLLPLDPDVRGQILSVLGVLLSAVIALSSTSLVGNALAGIMMRLQKSYRPGDFIEVDNLIGRVSDLGLFHTEVQLITRDIVALPNLYLSQRPVHVTRSSGTFVSALVSLGYDVPSSRAEEALREAVEAAGLDEGFVLVDELHDHAIAYQVFGLLGDTNELLTARSRLRRSIIATLHANGIQIVSPGFVNRVEYPTDHRFIPEQAEPEQEVREEAESTEKVEAIAFDKAEEAESIERLYALRDKLAHEREELDSTMKEADRDERGKLQEERKEIERRIERTSELIERREAEQADRELDE